MLAVCQVAMLISFEQTSKSTALFLATCYLIKGKNVFTILLLRKEHNSYSY